jgi:putative membrane protein
LVAAGATAYARASYRSLGHAVEDRYLVVRRGALVRRTVALRRTGIIGWTVRSTVFQRRLGLATVVATTAAGRGAYALVDVDAHQGLRVAGEAVPGLLDPFLTGA